MRNQLHIHLLIGVTLLAMYCPSSQAQSDEPTPPVEQLLDQLGDDDFRLREQATRRLFTLGESIAPQLQTSLTTETDPEIRHRLRYLLENLTPPRQAVLVIRATPDCGLRTGMIITHANSRRVRDRTALRQQLVRAGHGALLRIRLPDGPREIGPIQIHQLTELSDYSAPRGRPLSEIVHLYDTGYVERAYELLRELPQPIPGNELSAPLHARIAYTAGDAATGLELIRGHADDVRATGADWSSPSYFDRRGPGKAPFHLEWAVSTQAGKDFYSTRDDPDLRIQRILLPARRFTDALELTAGYWWKDYRNRLGTDDTRDHVGGNQLAVAAWMLYGLDLRSECCRLIEPRSAVLRRAGSGYRKWIRVDTDAWLPFFAGDSHAALDGFHDDAMDVLQHPPRPGDRTLLTRNPHVAARVAFFLYQLPDDPRVEQSLTAVNHHTHPALTDYLDWMLLALHEQNQLEVRRDLQTLFIHVPDAEVLPYARAVALLEYVQDQPDREVIRAARQRIANAPPSEQRETWLAITDALLELLAARPNRAHQILKPLRGRPEIDALWHTVNFIIDPPATAESHQLLRNPLLTIPFGTSTTDWLVLTRERRLLRFDAGASLLTAIDKPTPTWFPNPLTWPWIGREAADGRVWVYDRRRVIEINQNSQQTGLRLNIDTADIPIFNRHVAPYFSRLHEALNSTPWKSGENGEFLRSEIKTNSEYTSDPDLREIALIQTLADAPRIVCIALRGGPQMLIDTRTGRSWTSAWIGTRLNLDSPPDFFSRALPTPTPDDSSILMLMSNQGLIRFELDYEQLTRVALPGEDPYPALVPESTPYQRRDPRYVYCARLPEVGGAVYRVRLEDDSVEKLDMINEALPAHYYDTRSRAELRAAINRRFQDEQLPELQAFIADAIETVSRWNQEQQQQP